MPFGYGFYWGDTTWFILIPALLLSLWAQYAVSSQYKKYSQSPGKRGFTGAQVAYDLLAQQGITDVRVGNTSGKLSDHYDPKRRVVNLSKGVADSSSVAALGIAAHEVGHALQDAEAYGPMKLRAFLIPVANIGSQAAMPLFLIGLVLSLPLLQQIGILAFAVAVVFQLINLPVEFNASRRALAALSDGGYLAPDEMPGARKVLRAAAMTYVASTLMALTQLLRLLMLSNRRKN